MSGLVAALTALPDQALALNYVWQGGTGFWDDSSRWSLLGVPGSQDSASIPNNTGTGAVLVRDPRSLAQLYMNGGNLAATSTLTVADLHFGSGYFGRSNAQAGGLMNVTGSASFNGAFVQDIAFSHVINLAADASWTRGDGRLSVDPAYWQGDQRYASAALNIGAGTTFSDAGASSAASYKRLGGGEVNNSGRYLRSGLGLTIASGFNNTGTLSVAGGDFSLDGSHFANRSSGSIEVASGSTLFLNNTSFTAGTLDNKGLVRQFGGDVSVASSVAIGGAWQLDAGALKLQGQHRVDTLTLNGGLLTGVAELSTGSLVFNCGTLGGYDARGGNVLNVTGAAHFNGAGVQHVHENQTLNLQGSSRWSAGDGVLSTATSSSGGHTASHLRIAVAASFVDEGAGSASSYKTLGGAGWVVNEGSYLRGGLGETYAPGFQNKGLLHIVSGSFSVDDRFFNAGQVELDAGALLKTYRWEFANAGWLGGNGRVKTFDSFHALTNNGTLDPGQASLLGTLTIDGDLDMGDAAVLRIDLAGGRSDSLVVTDDVRWNGELALWVAPGTVLQPGDSYTIATYGHRLGASSFTQVSWHGLSPSQYSIDYGDTSITLRVSAVPEPASGAFLALGLGLLAVGTLRRSRRNSGAA
ncbi:PEP-CTERM sorting domain-containing protein [Paucibacter sp. APW11]|uniref:PEP-CTERM sorting domain-containing protein n=1 Tax=Roseateles aquae TaxID=3077235 RepID=A0ABU3PE58_9BURK|nr:PEP-CTERM sorting domain-containing protein [Paucibacter sp. APW11]MDT9000843.1 PEP-CTERM sorting domain-containing protein [Paucibacter sp. APW11]